MLSKQMFAWPEVDHRDYILPQNARVCVCVWLCVCKFAHWCSIVCILIPTCFWLTDAQQSRVTEKEVPAGEERGRNFCTQVMK